VNSRQKLIDFARAAGITGAAMEAFINLLDDAISYACWVATGSQEVS